MTQAFPLPLADFALTLPVKNFAWKLQEVQDVDGLGAGNLLVADFGMRFWRAKVQLDSMSHAEASEIQAMIESLDGSLNNFYFHDPRLPFPVDDPKGAILAAGTAIPIGGQAVSGNVETGVYRAEGNAITLSQAVSVVGDAGTYFDADGVLRLAAANVPRLDHGPFGNQIRNSKAAGASPGTPGTLPNFWQIVTVSGISQQILGAGVEDGIDYVDIRWFGTAATTGARLLAFEGNQQISAAIGQTWTSAFFFKLLDSTDLPVNGFFNVLTGRNSAGNFVEGNGSFGQAFVPSTVLTRYPASLTLANAASAVVRSGLNTNLQPSETIDFAMRVGFPTLEKGAAASAYPRKPIGIAVEKATINKVTCRKNNPTDTSGVTKSGDAASTLALVSDSAVLATSGLATICSNGNVYRLDNSAGATAAFATLGGTFGNTNAHSVQAFIRGGAGAIGDTSNSARTTFVASSTYQPIQALNFVPANSAHQMVIQANAGQVVYFILPQMEEGAAISLPIIGSTLAAVARAADQVTFKAKGVNDFTLTFDNNATQAVADIAGNWTPLASSLNRPRIKSWAAVRKTQPAAESVKIAEVNANNKEIRLKGLPSGFRLRRGVMFHRDYGSNPVHRGLYRCNTKLIVADAAGETDWLEFRPHFIPGSAAVNDVIVLAQPAALCKIVPNSLNEGQPAGTRNYGMSFDIIQVP